MLLNCQQPLTFLCLRTANNRQLLMHHSWSSGCFQYLAILCNTFLIFCIFSFYFLSVCYFVSNKHSARLDSSLLCVPNHNTHTFFLCHYYPKWFMSPTARFICLLIYVYWFPHCTSVTHLFLSALVKPKFLYVLFPRGLKIRKNMVIFTLTSAPV